MSLKFNIVVPLIVIILIQLLALDYIDLSVKKIITDLLEDQQVLLLAICVIIFLLVIIYLVLHFQRKAIEEKLPLENPDTKMTEQQYKQHIKETTNSELEKLKQDPRYQQLLKDKQDGKVPNFADLQIAEEDKIVLSDDEE